MRAAPALAFALLLAAAPAAGQEADPAPAAPEADPAPPAARTDTGPDGRVTFMTAGDPCGETDARRPV